MGVFETLKEISRLALDSVRDRLAEDRAAAAPSPAPVAATEVTQPELRADSAPPEDSPPLDDPAPEDAPPPTGPVKVEFAEEDTDKKRVRPVPTKESPDIGKELEKLREMTQDPPPRAPTAVTGAKGGDTPPEVATGGRDARQEIERRATLEVAPHLLKGLTDLRIHLGFDRDGREEILRDAVRLTLVGTRRLKKLRVRLDLDLTANKD